jgi:serine/threonine protein kinase
VTFFIILIGSGLGAVGAVVKPGVDTLLTLASGAQAGVFWWLCRRGVRSISVVVGTPQYMAPESILKPDSVDARTDIYALGAVAYYLLAGVDVFNGQSVLEVCSQHLHQEPKPLSARGVAIPAELEAVVLGCLNKDPGRRPQSAAELRRRVEACTVEPWDSERARA